MTTIQLADQLIRSGMHMSALLDFFSPAWEALLPTRHPDLGRQQAGSRQACRAGLLDATPVMITRASLPPCIELPGLRRDTTW